MKLWFVSIGFVGVVAWQMASGEAIYFHSDHLGSTAVVSDSSGAVQQIECYTPFGESVSGSRSTSHASSFTYTNQEFDRESTLYDYGARYYDPVVARFQSSDPAMEDRYTIDPQQQNPYSYVRNNPLRYIDPDGRVLKEVAKYTADQLPILDKNLMDAQEALRYLFEQEQILADRLATLLEHPNIRILEMEAQHPHLRGQTDLLEKLVADEAKSVQERLIGTKRWIWWVRWKMIATKFTRGATQGLQRVSSALAEGVVTTEATATNTSVAEGGAAAARAASALKGTGILSVAWTGLRLGSTGLAALQAIEWYTEANEALQCDPGASCPGTSTPLQGPEERIRLGTSPGQISPYE
ncbi:MAG: RHS repeat-associated core domain-containing protein [Deltaproteobacteria bacterium]|nr:RHS repeat-associated core domain-containing protein [Deltaproteobacteria bacterium]